tara:strand:+ start:457 stop:633 length:177 start_codon:yes stop_codon:yes gene_type:complete
VDQAWETDITYIPLQNRFVYLVASVNPIARKVLNWKLSNSYDTEFCIKELEMALRSGH